VSLEDYQSFDEEVIGIVLPFYIDRYRCMYFSINFLLLFLGWGYCYG